MKSFWKKSVATLLFLAVLLPLGSVCVMAAEESSHTSHLNPEKDLPTMQENSISFSCHYDPETAPVFFKKSRKPMSVLGPTSVRAKAMGDLCGQNYILFDKYTSVTLEGFRFTATRAAHSDPYAIGVVIEDLVENRVYYVTGDTLYNSRIFDSLPELYREIDVLFLPINGVGNNMNMTDAARFAKKTHAMTVVPYHFGMFDSLDPNDFECRNKVIPVIWEEIEV